MKNISLFTGVFALSAMLLVTSCNQGKNTTAPVVSNTPAVGGSGKIAFVNLDSLENQYILLKTRREEFKQRQDQMENELQRSFQQMQEDAAQVQKKIQNHTITESEYEAAQKRLGQMQQTLESRKQALTEQLIKEQSDFNQDLKTRLDAFLEEYNKTKGYDYILSYSASGSILYANKALDVTKDVVDGMNARAKDDMDKKNK